MEIEELSRNFDLVKRATGVVWLHKDKPVWVVPYSAIHGVRARFFRAYYAIHKVPKARRPWSIDNRAFGDSFPSLCNAMKAAVEFQMPNIGARHD